MIGNRNDITFIPILAGLSKINEVGEGAAIQIIVKPVTKGKEVSQTEYNEIIKKKMEEMQEMNGGPGGGGNRMQFRMGR